MHVLTIILRLAFILAMILLSRYNNRIYDLEEDLHKRLNEEDIWRYTNPFFLVFYLIFFVWVVVVEGWRFFRDLVMLRNKNKI